MSFPKSRTGPSKTHRKRGRPPTCTDAERDQRILQAAERVFTTSGYGAATMEEIARAAGMAKKTLYGLYADKRVLFAAVAVSADDFPWDDARQPNQDAALELRHRLIAATSFALSPRQLQLTRLLIAEAAHAPELADHFHERVIAKCQAYVAEALERCQKSKLGPTIRDATLLSQSLLGSALGQLHLLALFGKLEAPSTKQIATYVELAMVAHGFRA